MGKYKIIIVVSIVIILIVSGFLIYKYAIKENKCPGDAKCSNNGECIDGKCKCRQDFKGDDCKERSTTGCPTGCASPNGRCNSSTGKCDCMDGFTGDYCKMKKCPGDGTCSGNRECIDGECKCKNGYVGNNCVIASEKLKFNTIYKLKSNFQDKFLDTCGLYPLINNAFNVILTSTIPDYGFKLLKVGDITSTTDINTTDKFYIYDVKNDSYIQFSDKESGSNCIDNPSQYGYKAVSINVDEPSRIDQWSYFYLTNSDGLDVFNSTLTNTEYIIKLANSSYYMNTCGKNSYCNDERNVGFSKNMDYPNKLWKFII